MINSLRILLFFLVLGVCSCNQDTERKEEGSLKKKSGKITSTSGYSVKDVKFYLGESNSMYLGSFDELEVHFGKEHLTEVNQSFAMISGQFHEIDRRGVMQFLEGKNIYGLSEKGEITGLFTIEKAHSEANLLGGGEGSMRCMPMYV